MKAYLAGVGFSLAVGFSFLGVKTCVPIANTLMIMTHRYNVAFLAVMILVLLKLGKVSLKNKPKKNLIFTAFFYLMFMVVQAAGLIFSTSIESAILFAIVPVIVQVLARIILKERTNMWQNMFMCLSVSALVAMIIIGATDVDYDFIGICLLFISSVFMALNNVFMRYVRNDYTPFEITFATSVLGFAGFNGAAIIWMLFTGDFYAYVEPLTHTEFLVAIIYLGTFCILLSAQLMSYMQAHMPATNASLFGNVSTAISIVAGALVLGEPLRLYHIICTVLILTGVIGMSMAGRKRVKDGRQ